MNDTDALSRAVEAVLFASDEPMTAEEISGFLGSEDNLGPVLEQLAEDYRGRGVAIVRRGRKWHFETAPDMAHYLRKEREEPRKLSRAGIETLAIIAYHEPVSRAEIEAIRGVQISKGTLDLLMEAGWVKPAGRRDVPGRPLLFATTPAFLDHFGLESRRDLPGIAELKATGLLDPIDLAMENMDFASAEKEDAELETEGQDD